MLTHPQFDPVAIHLGSFGIHWYGLMYLLGFIVFIWLGRKRLHTLNQPGWDDKFLDDLLFYGVLGVVLGGRLGEVLFYNPGYYFSHPLKIFAVWEGGMSFHGGFLGCVTAVLLFGWKRNVPVLSLGDITCAVGPIGLFLGRIANFINGELWGRPADVPWAMVFPTGGPIPRHPSQLYEATLEGIVLFTVLALLIRCGALKRPGFILGSFATLYGLARITGEFFREPDPQLGFLWGGTTMGMLLSIPMILAGLGFLAVAMRRKPLNAS